MEEVKSLPLFRKIDQAIFERIDKFKQTPNYTPFQDFYNGLEEEQQKIFKGIVILAIILLPFLGLSLIWIKNNDIKEDLALRTSIVSKASQVIGQTTGLNEITPNVFSENPIDDTPMMTSRLSSLLSKTGIDLSKIQVKDFIADISKKPLVKSEANFAFNNISTDDLVNIFTSMITSENFRISSVEIKRNSDTSMLQGKFHAIHFSIASPESDGEE